MSVFIKSKDQTYPISLPWPLNAIATLKVLKGDILQKLGAPFTNMVKFNLSTDK